ncbi:Arc family DNA-binding protein [Devosia sp. RR2S18]|uniref:Arc family DNA-binding protein n=1 Tax=Devosia rhizosphaerae TaxID=3049774 RepID=UPI002542060E|nr:Arc family DNA-binding protein [Devosia sp. RR2S18]WIJ26619.1 Arc family DNA-binding protein [Devosia sp. RR2S18]
MARNDPQINIRLPIELKERLEEEAQSNNRAFKAEVVARLQASFEDNFGDAVLLERIRELVLAKRMNDLFGAEISDAIGVYASSYSEAETWHEAAAELIRLGLVAAEILPPDESKPAGGRDLRYWSTPEGRAFMEKHWEDRDRDLEEGSRVLDELTRPNLKTDIK